MIIGVLKEERDPRISMVPQVAKKLGSLGEIELIAEENLTDLFSLQDYESAGVKIKSRKEVLEKSNIILLFNPLPASDIASLKKGALIISHMDPYNNRDYVKKIEDAGISTISMEMIPRSTIAQKMDALSSQASLAGYVAVLIGANLMNKIFPMMMTPSGTIPPAKVFIIGVGVAGLQAIATAKRLGAKVEAFDTRPVVEEQVQSLGAKFIKVDLGEMSQTKDGYANELTAEQLAKQQEAMAKACASADLVITTAKLFGRKAPVIVTKKIISQMKKGSVIVDLAAGTGGNVEGTVLDQTVEINGVNVVGIDNLAGLVPIDASTMYANNLFNLLAHFQNKESKELDLIDDEIAKACVITLNGKLVNERLIEFYGKGGN